MARTYLALKQLTEQLMKEVRDYGIREVSTGQYQNVCNSIIRFAESLQVDSYSLELMDSYKNDLDKRCSAGGICKEYRRFQYRVIRILSSLAENSRADFLTAKFPLRKYPVSDEAGNLVEKILDSYPISDATKKDLRAPTRHFLWYAEQRGIKPESIDDNTVMSYLIDEVPVSNVGGTGRTLRCVKYATRCLKEHGSHNIHRDYTLLKLKNGHRRIIPAYSEEEIVRIADAADTDNALGKRDLAITLTAYCTGLRGIDIISIKSSDIDWHNHKVVHFYGKGRKHRITPLSREIWVQFGRYREKYHCLPLRA